MNIIQQLKDNEKPFGLMSEEMQAKMDEIGIENFIHGKEWCVYVLRPDYAEEPEIVECEIILNPESNIWGYKCPYSGDPINADYAHSCPGFRLTGFKFADGKIRSLPIMYSKFGDVYYVATERHLGNYEVLHATAVLFRRQK